MSEQDDLVKQLRGRSLYLRHFNEVKSPGLLTRAADEIEALRARLEKAEAERDQLVEQQIAAVNDLQTARNDALEEAANLCIRRGENNPQSYGQYSNAAFSIRALKGKS